MRVQNAQLWVHDQDEALDFYVGKLGMVVHTDADLGVMRFLTVNLPDEPNVELVLMLPGPPAYDDATAAEIRELVTKGAAPCSEAAISQPIMTSTRAARFSRRMKSTAFSSSLMRFCPSVTQLE